MTRTVCRHALVAKQIGAALLGCSLHALLNEQHSIFKPTCVSMLPTQHVWLKHYYQVCPARLSIPQIHGLLNQAMRYSVS